MKEMGALKNECISEVRLKLKKKEGDVEGIIDKLEKGSKGERIST